MASLLKKSAKPAEAEAGATPAKKKPSKPPFTLKPTKQTCIILGAGAGAVLAASIGLFVWQNNEITQVETQVKQKQDEVSNGKKIADHLAQVEADYANMQGELRYLETSVSPGEYVPTLLKQMERLAKQVSLSVQSTRPTLEPAPEPPADKEAKKKFKPWPYDKLHVDMEVSGTYWSVATMLYRLNNFEKIIAVENVQITPVQGENGYSHKLNVKLRLTGFIFKTEDRNKPADAKPEEKTAQTVGEEKPAQTRA